MLNRREFTQWLAGAGLIGSTGLFLPGCEQRKELPAAGGGGSTTTGAGKKSRDIVKELLAQVQEKSY